VLDVDVQSFFDTISHEKLRELLGLRVADGVVTRLIGKWLQAGVLEGGVIHRAEQGTPQGGVISPLLANVYLHEVLDKWWVQEVRPRCSGAAHLIRYADDFVMVFERKEDADRVFAALPQRFAHYGLTLHPDKTRLVRFAPPTQGGTYAESFDFLGFTHYLGRTRRGYWTPHRRTSRKRFSRSLRALNTWLRQARHLPLADQARQLGMKLRGHIQYYGIRGNSRAVNRYHEAAQRLWWKWLGRRSQKSRLTWEAFTRLLRHHPLPSARLPPGWRQIQLRLALWPANP
jgi:group II intron reverse transcriptase/maturase